MDCIVIVRFTKGSDCKIAPPEPPRTNVPLPNEIVENISGVREDRFDQ